MGLLLGLKLLRVLVLMKIKSSILNRNEEEELCSSKPCLCGTELLISLCLCVSLLYSCLFIGERYERFTCRAPAGVSYFYFYNIRLSALIR